MKKSFLLVIIISSFSLLLVQCNSNQQPVAKTEANATDSAGKAKPIAGSDTVVVMQGINSKGIGRFNNIKLAEAIDVNMSSKGEAVYQSKCFACHKLTTELLVGPGWMGVTSRRTPAWIMNWITNTKVMLDKDQAAQADMVVCLIRMPNQDLSDEQARDVLEFMRSNDKKK